MQSSRTDEPPGSLIGVSEDTDSRLQQLPRRCVSSGISRSVRIARAEGNLPDETAWVSTSYSPMRKLGLGKGNSHLEAAETDQGADPETIETQSAVYSSWFALLSKSIGSDVGSPSWVNSKQIEGA